MCTLMMMDTLILTLVVSGLGGTWAAASPGVQVSPPSQPSLASLPAGEETVDAAKLLEDSDRARGAVPEGLSWRIQVETIEDSDVHKVEYLVKAKGNDALAEAVAPARNKGEMMLFNERNLWFFKPGVKKPVSLSPRQKLMGQAANGDIASTNYFRDYTGKVIGEELINGEPTWKLELKAKAKNVTYDGITYWIAKKSRVGVKADFLSVSGQVFKTAVFSYGNELERGGKKYPFVSTMVISDALKAGNKTSIVYDKPRIEAIADSLFNVNNLIR